MEYRSLGAGEEICHVSQNVAYGHGLLAAVAQFSCEQFSVQTFKAAVKQLHQWQPLLRARIEKKGVGHHFMIDPKARVTPIKIIARNNNLHWSDLMEEQLSRPFQNSEYQWRLRLIHNQQTDNHEVLLLISYSIADCFSAPLFFDALWTLYEDPKADLSQIKLQPSIENHLLHLKKESTLPPAQFLFSPIPYETNVAFGMRQTKTVCFTLPVGKSNKIKAFCKKEAINNESFFSALMIKCLAKTLNKPVSTYLHNLINLRPFSCPSVVDNYLSSCASAITTYHHSTPDSAIEELALDYNKQAGKSHQSFDTILPVIPDAFKSHAVVFTDSLIELLQCIDYFSLGPAVCNIGTIPFTGDYKLIKWHNYYFGNSHQAAAVPITLNIALFRQQFMFSFNYVQSLLSSSKANQFIDHFIHFLQKI